MSLLIAATRSRRRFTGRAAMLFFLLSLVGYSPIHGSEESLEVEAKVNAIKAKLIEVRRDLHRHPELGNRETRTARQVADYLKNLGLDVKTQVAKTGVVALLKGGRPGPTVALRADMDALPIQELNDVPYKSLNAGVKHACGHDTHMTVALGAAEVLAGMKDRLKGNVKFIFQPSEEGPPEGEEGGAKLMVKEGVLENPKVSAIFGLHVMPFLDVGTVGYRSGATMASADKFTIEIIGKKVHAAYPHTGIDPVPIAAQVVMGLQTIVSRQIDAREPAVLSIGLIEGGNRFNILADKVRLVGTVRTLNSELRKDIAARMEKVVKGITATYGASYKLSYEEGTAVTVNDPVLTRRILPVLERILGSKRVIVTAPQMGAEDFSYFGEQVPGFYYFLGVRNETKGITHQIHTEWFDVDEEAIPVGVTLMTSMVLDFLR
ncbi:MAG: amidohydrolase [Acidobacteria bacterium]|nr:amidohydrolase [Acidobacteriota bacterium]MBI3656318.1 amidohydrolase [Acidobacteriota bacterium]